MKTLVCTKCNLEKDISEFYPSKRHKLGYVRTCKPCEALRALKKYNPEKKRKHYLENREKYLLQTKEYNERNKEHVKKRHKKYYENNKLKFLESGWKRKGILNKNSEAFKKQDFDELFERSNYTCAICNTNAPKHLKGFVVDHCHNTGIARGILCAHCNLALGGFKDNVEILNKAINYLNDAGPYRGEDGC